MIAGNSINAMAEQVVERMRLGKVKCSCADVDRIKRFKRMLLKVIIEDSLTISVHGWTLLQ